MPDVKQCPECGSTYMGPVCPACYDAGAAGTTEKLPLHPGESFQGLKVVALVGRGGMGLVYQALQPQLDRMVALKLLAVEKAQDPAFQIRFEREAKALAALSHPNIVGIHDFGKANDLFYLVLEYVNGETLSQRLRRSPLSRDDAIRYGRQICDALSYAHGEGVIHRDIKPGNILINDRDQVKIADFGLAKLADRSPGALALTQSGLAIGTAHYMAPEQVQGSRDIDHRADIYSTAVVLYELLTGELPLGRFDRPSRLKGLDGKLDEAILKALSKRPEERFSTAAEFRDALHASASPATPFKPRRSSAVWLVPLLILLAASVAAVGLALLRTKTTPPVPSDGRRRGTPLLLDLLRFGPAEGPLGQRPISPHPTLPSNPFTARTAGEVDRVERFLETTLFDVMNNSIRAADVTEWPGGILVVLETPHAKWWASEALDRSPLPHKWSYWKGGTAVLVYSRRKSHGDVFRDLVRRVEQRVAQVHAK